ncbi:tyrosine-type recombinase/integrase [Streptosporangium minutum]|uniref:Integrase n=1 Tax=Streptosporangium minutum TaxID=569862 RepID=A0A243QHL7_9ACTN|nr:tyrosine-type recombinase/integrase [Streptosporangium minutum]OUC81214.1 integrase [Streptosporangium minutum]
MRPADLNRLTVQESADRYVELIRAKTLTGALSPATAEVYARDVATFVRLAGEGRVLDDLTGEDVDAILLAFARKPDGRRAEPGAGLQSASSQSRFRRSVSALFKHATLAGWVQVNPMALATVTAKERGGLRPERRALTREQAQGLIGAARDLSGHRGDGGGRGDAGVPDGAGAAPANGTGAERGRRRDQRTELRDALIVLLLSTMGPRVSELVRANVEDFYTNDGVRYWRIFGKGGKTRDVPLPGDVARVLEAYLLERGRAGAPEKALLLSWRGRRLARGDVQAVIDRVQRRVDPDRRRSVTPHGLRHTTATHLLADAVDMDAVRRVLGHSDLATLGRYRDELPGELEVAMRAHPLLRGPSGGR